VFLYKGAKYCDQLWRPTRDGCIMRSLGVNKFCRVCRERGIKPRILGQSQGCPAAPSIEWWWNWWGGPR
jgi:hypothetical protein